MNEEPIRDRIKEFRRVPAAQLQANPRNWRTHPTRQANALRGVLARIGYAGALLARETPDGLVLIDGHLRAEITPDMDLPVLILDVTEAEADEILLTHDPLAAMAETDRNALADLLESHTIADADILAMLDDLALQERIQLPLPTGLTELDAIPVNPPPVAQRGELWALGDHRLMCGDCTAAGDVSRLMGEAAADVLWTDPPYGVSYEGKTEEALIIANDTAEGLAGLLRAAFDQAAVALKPGAPFYIARPAGALSLTFGNALLEGGWKLHQELQWVKDAMVLGHSDYHLKHETIMYGWLPGAGRSGRGKHEGSRWYGNNAQTSVFEIPRPKSSRDHPTSKPVELVERCLANSSRAGDIVFEPFCGSGSTIIACQRLQRRAYAIEIEPRYVDVAIKRWEDFTGQQASLISKSETAEQIP